MSAIDVIIKLIAQGDSAVKSAIKGVGDTLRGAAKDTDSLKGGLENVRNAAAGLAVTGGVGLVFSEGLIGASLEADRLGGKLNSLMTGKGLQGGIDQVKELANALAGLTGGDDDTIAAGLGGAIASGRLNSLREYGIVIDANGQAAIAAAGKISAQAKSQEILNQVLRAGGQAVNNLRAGTSEAAVALGEFNVRWGNLEEGIGAGAANAKAAILGGVLSPIMSVLEASPDLQSTAGAFLYIGSSALTVTGSLISVGSQVGILAMSFPGLATSAAGAFTVVKGAAASTIPFLTGVATALAIPFAILAAGVAVGVAGYEALRAANIGGFGDTHKSSAEILADTRKMLMGDPAADAKAATDAAMKNVPVAPVLPAPISAPVPPPVLPSVSQAPVASMSPAGLGSSDPRALALSAMMDAPSMFGANTTSSTRSGDGDSNTAGGGSQTLDVSASFKTMRAATGEIILRITVPDVTIKDGLAQLGRSL